jgi:type I restriction enzyme, S subunit
MNDVSPLGPLPTGWCLARLGDLSVKIGSGATPTGGEKVYLPCRQRFALIRSQCVHDREFDLSALSFISDEDAARLRSARVQPGDVLLNITGDGVTFSRASLAPPDALPACVNQHVAIIRPNRERLLSGFLLSYLTHPQVKNYIESFNAGGSRRAITKGHIERFLVPLPSLEEQTAIATLLSMLDDKIELNRRMNETLEAMARAIFKDFFVGFGPTRAKAEGRTPYLARELWDLFPAGLNDDDEPEGWKLSRFGDFAELAYGKALKAETRRAGTFPVYGSNGQVGWHDEALVRGPGVVVGRKGNPGTSQYVHTDFFCIDTTFYVVPRHSAWSPVLLWLLIDHLGLPALSADSAVPGLNREIAHGAQCVMPSKELAQAFGEIAGPLMALRFQNEEENRALAQTRDLLLPKLMSGEIRVKDAEKVLAEVA